MGPELRIRLPREIAGVRVVPAPAGGADPRSAGVSAAGGAPGAEAELEIQRRVEAERAQLRSACQALTSAASQLQDFRRDLLKDAEGQLVDLATGIARKILMREVQAGRHEIEPIVKEALARVPPHHDVVVHLNPGDWARRQTAQQGDEAAESEHVRFVSDPEVGPAECVLETPEGIVESTLDAHLSEIGEALKTPE